MNTLILYKCITHNNNTKGFMTNGVWHCILCWEQDILGIPIGKILDEFKYEDIYIREISIEQNNNVLIEVFKDKKVIGLHIYRYLSQADRSMQSLAQDIIKIYNEDVPSTDKKSKVKDLMMGHLGYNYNRSHKEVINWYKRNIFNNEMMPLIMNSHSLENPSYYEPQLTNLEDEEEMEYEEYNEEEDY